MTYSERAVKSRNLRYKKSIARGFNIQEIWEELIDIRDEMGDVRYYADADIDELVEALDGDEEEAYEFRMMFSDLSAEADRLYDLILENREDTGVFDVFFAAVAGGAVELLGYDVLEDDYFKMTRYEQKLGENEAEKKLMRMTKADIIRAARHCFGIACAFLNIRYKSEYLKAAMDVLKEENHAYLETVKDIEKLYDEAEKDRWLEYAESVKKLDAILNALPDKAWVE